MTESNYASSMMQDALSGLSEERKQACDTL